MNVQGDRLSILPEDLILKILSLIGIKLVVQTSALSSRWRYLWTLLPCLNFSSKDFETLDTFSKVVTHVLSCRNNQIEVSSAKLSFCGKASQAFVKRILNYAFSHNVKQLTVSCLPEGFRKNETNFPLTLFSSQSLEHLTVAGFSYMKSVIVTSTWELASLTTLHLEYIKFNDEVTAKDTGIFSKCANLKKLVLKGCSMTGSNGVDICHPGLSNLTLENGHFFINVIVPQLKNLTVIYCKGLHLISAPELVSLRFKGGQSQWLQFSSYGFSSLENVDLRIIKERGYNPNKPDAHTIFDLLQQLHNVKYLTLNLEIFELLFPLMELISHQPSPFVNLKSLKVHPDNDWAVVLQTIPAEVKKYLLDGSPSATFTEVSYEELRALKKAESALYCMTELREMLEHDKANIETNISHLDLVEIPVECHEPNMHEQDKMQINKWEMRDQIGSCWNDLRAQIDERQIMTYNIIKKLREIQEILTELPASKRSQIETSFSQLCTEADTVMNAIMNSMKIQFDEKQSRLSIYFQELAIAPNPSF